MVNLHGEETLGDIRVDFGFPNSRKIVALEDEFGKRLMETYPTTYCQISPEAVIPPKISAPQPTSVEDISVDLAGKFQIPGLFMTELADALRESKGDVFPMTGALTDNELFDELSTRGYIKPMTVNDWNQHLIVYTGLRAEVAELRTRGDGLLAQVESFVKFVSKRKKAKLVSVEECEEFLNPSDKG